MAMHHPVSRNRRCFTPVGFLGCLAQALGASECARDKNHLSTQRLARMCEGRHLEEEEITGLSRSPKLREGQGLIQGHTARLS